MSEACNPAVKLANLANDPESGTTSIQLFPRGEDENLPGPGAVRLHWIRAVVSNTTIGGSAQLYFEAFTDLPNNDLMFIDVPITSTGRMTVEFIPPVPMIFSLKGNTSTQHGFIRVTASRSSGSGIFTVHNISAGWDEWCA